MYRRILVSLLLTFLLLIIKIPDGQSGATYFDRLNDEEKYFEKVIGADVFFEILDPPELEYTYRLKLAQEFGVPFDSSFPKQKIGLVLANPLNGCEFAKNAKDIEGQVAMVERGDCSFFSKAVLAEQAGAKAIIITDYIPNSLEEDISSPLWLDYHYIEMVKDDSIPDAKKVNIPAGFLLGRNGKMIRKTLQELKRQYALINIPVNLTFASLDKLNQPPWISW